jgi:hypothetical protein
MDAYENAAASIRIKHESDSNKSCESRVQCEKHDPPRTSTLRGITIDRINDDRNASDSIRVSRETGSNEIDESDW